MSADAESGSTTTSLPSAATIVKEEPREWAEWNQTDGALLDKDINLQIAEIKKEIKSEPDDQPVLKREKVLKVGTDGQIRKRNRKRKPVSLALALSLEKERLIQAGIKEAKDRENRPKKLGYKNYNWDYRKPWSTAKKAKAQREGLLHILEIWDLPLTWTYNDVQTLLQDCDPATIIKVTMENAKLSKKRVRIHFQDKRSCLAAKDKLSDIKVLGEKLHMRCHFIVDNATSGSDTSDSDCTEPKAKRPKRKHKVWRPDVDVFEKDPSGLYGLKPEFLKSLNITQPIDQWVHVTNFRCSKTELKEAMDLAGEVLICNMYYNPKSANVMYRHPLEAVQAVSMLNNQMFYGLQLKVVMDFNPPLTYQLPNGLTCIGPGLGIYGKPLRDVVRHYERYLKRQTNMVDATAFEPLQKVLCVDDSNAEDGYKPFDDSTQDSNMQEDSNTQDSTTTVEKQKSTNPDVVGSVETTQQGETQAENQDHDMEAPNNPERNGIDENTHKSQKENESSQSSSKALDNEGSPKINPNTHQGTQNLSEDQDIYIEPYIPMPIKSQNINTLKSYITALDAADDSGKSKIQFKSAKKSETPTNVQSSENSDNKFSSVTSEHSKKSIGSSKTLDKWQSSKSTVSILDSDSDDSSSENSGSQNKISGPPSIKQSSIDESRSSKCSFAMIDLGSDPESDDPMSDYGNKVKKSSQDRISLSPQNQSSIPVLNRDDCSLRKAVSSSNIERIVCGPANQNQSNFTRSFSGPNRSQNAVGYNRPLGPQGCGPQMPNRFGGPIPSNTTPMFGPTTQNRPNFNIMSGPRPMNPGPNYGQMNMPGPRGPMNMPGPSGPMNMPGPSGPLNMGAPSGPMNMPGPSGPMNMNMSVPRGPMNMPGPSGPNIANPMSNIRYSGPNMGPSGPRGPVGSMGGPMIAGPNPGPMRMSGPNVGPMNVPMGPINGPRMPGPGAGPSDLASTTVELSNLPLSTTFPLLSSKMGECGQVTSLRLTAPGRARVQFAQRAQAQKCWQMYNNANIQGNVVRVTFV